MKNKKFIAWIAVAFLCLIIRGNVAWARTAYYYEFGKTEMKKVDLNHDGKKEKVKVVHNYRTGNNLIYLNGKRVLSYLKISEAALIDFNNHDSYIELFVICSKGAQNEHLRVYRYKKKKLQVYAKGLRAKRGYPLLGCPFITPSAVSTNHGIPPRQMFTGNGTMKQPVYITDYRFFGGTTDEGLPLFSGTFEYIIKNQRFIGNTDKTYQNRSSSFRVDYHGQKCIIEKLRYVGDKTYLSMKNIYQGNRFTIYMDTKTSGFAYW